MNKSYLCHYKNKYPKGKVEHGDDKLDVYDKDSNLRVSLRKTGAGTLKDIGPEVGALDRHDLEPIPKEARVFKLYADGRVSPSEEAKERLEAVAELEVDGKILSIKEYEAKGLRFDQDGKLVKRPAPQAPAASDQE